MSVVTGPRCGRHGRRFARWPLGDGDRALVYEPPAGGECNWGLRTGGEALCRPGAIKRRRKPCAGFPAPRWVSGCLVGQLGRAGASSLVQGRPPGSCSGTLCRVKASVQRASPPAALARLEDSHDRAIRPAAGRGVRGRSRLAALRLTGGLGRSPVAPSGLRFASPLTMRRRWPSERSTSTCAVRWCTVRERDRRRFVPGAATPTCRPAIRASERS